MGNIMKDYSDFFLLLSQGEAMKKIEVLNNKAENTVKNKGKFILAGNGGSMSIALHIASELTGRFKTNRKAVPSYVLGCNSSSMSSISNDFSYENIFIRELKAFINPNDFVILMSTSGKSPNIIRCIEYLDTINHLNNVLLTGGDPHDRLFPKNITSITAPSKVTARIQEYHLFILHEMCNYIDSLF